MTEERFEDLFGEKKIKAPKLKPGDRLEAMVAGISGENVFLDIGGKSEGVLAASELRGPDGELKVKSGDMVSVFFLAARGGEMLFTTRLGSGHVSSQELEDAFNSGIPVQGRVTGEIKGGFQVLVAGQRGFCPYSQMDIRRIEDPAAYLDQVMAFRIMEYGSQGRNLIVSARAVLEEERAERREQLVQTLKEGDRVRGTVTSLRDFGAFVDIGGVDGLIPVSELAWGQVGSVADVLSQGQEVEVVVRKLDWDHDRISLSLKETLENPWQRVQEKYPPGSIHRGQVTRLAQFGAFVALEPGVDGLLHISRLGGGRKLHHPREAVEVGQEITVRIESIDPGKQRISLVPEDYTESAEAADKSEGKPYIPAPPRSLGTLGDVLASSLRKKKS